MAQFQFYICLVLRQATHTPSLSPWCQLLPSEPRVYCVYLLRLWPNHIYPTVFTHSTHAAMSFSLFHPRLPVQWPLLWARRPLPSSASSSHFHSRRQTVHYVANIELWKSGNGNNKWAIRRKKFERKYSSQGMNIIVIWQIWGIPGEWMERVMNFFIVAYSKRQ